MKNKVKLYQMQNSTTLMNSENNNSEKQMSSKMSQTQNISKQINVSVGENKGTINFKERPDTKSILGEVINELVKIPCSYEDISDELTPFDIFDKIEFNFIDRYKSLIFDYYQNLTNLKEIYFIIEEIIPFAKDKLYRLISVKYKEHFSILLKEFNNNLRETLKNNSDNIIDFVRRYLLDLLEKSSNLSKNAYIEHIEDALNIIIVDAFIECKILEKPRGLL